MINNIVVEALNEKHGAEIIKTLKELGVNTAGYSGHCCLLNKDNNRFYGVINEEFDNYRDSIIDKSVVKILTLNELKALVKPTYPKIMLVSDDGSNWVKRVVIAEKQKQYIAWYQAETVDDAEREITTYAWSYAKDLPDVVEMTIEQIANKLGINPDCLKIVK